MNVQFITSVSVVAPDPPKSRELFVDEGLRLAVVGPARYLRGLERRLRLPA